jgi:hypothetical protein
MTTSVSLLVLTLAAADAEPKSKASFEGLPARRMIGDAALLRFVLSPEEGKAGPNRVVAKSCVCVRGIFPRNEQIALMAKTLKIDPKEARKQFELLDFQLERQEASTAKPDWKTIPWKDVPIKPASQLLTESTEFVPEVVHDEESDPVITMPLPKLSIGHWKTLATHPALKAGEPSGNSLFRFIDSDVSKGKIYRYRVRFEYADRDPESHISVAQRTPWSDPTPEIKVDK